MKKVYFLLGILCCLSGCALNPMSSVYDNDTKIASEENTFNLGEVTQAVKETTWSATIKKIEGMETVWTYLAEEEQDLRVVCNITAKNGKAKLVLISPDGTLNTLLEVEEKLNVEDVVSFSKMVSMKKGENRLKLVAEKDTQLEISINIEEGTFQTLGIY